MQQRLKFALKERKQENSHDRYVRPTLIAFLGFVAVILAICGITYLNADRLEAFLNRKLKARRQVDKNSR